MRTTTTAMAVATTAIALANPAAASAAEQSNMQVPLAGHLTVSSQMREHHRGLAQQRLTRKATRLARASRTRVTASSRRAPTGAASATSPRRGWRPACGRCGAS